MLSYNLVKLLVLTISFISTLSIRWLKDKSSAANKYSSANHHEQKNKKTTGQIKFWVVTIKQQMKLVLQPLLQRALLVDVLGENLLVR